MNGSLIFLDIDARLGLEFTDKVLLDLNVEVLTTESSVTVGGLDFEDSTGDFENRDIVGTTTEIVNSDDLAISLVETESEGSSSRLVDDTLNLEVGNLASVLGGLTLGIIEVSGDSDDGLLDGATEIGLGSFLHLGEDESSDLGGGVLLATALNPSVSVGGSDNLVRQVLHVLLGSFVLESAANQALGGVDSVLGVLHSLAFGDISDKAVAVLGKGDD